MHQLADLRNPSRSSFTFAGDEANGSDNNSPAGSDFTINEKPRAQNGNNSSSNGSTVPRLNANSPISYFYLTFLVELPTPPTLEQYRLPPNHEEPLPSCPDLRSYVSPSKWSSARKSIVLLLSCLATFLASIAASAYAVPSPLMAKDFGTSGVVILIGITMFCLGFAFAPMVLAPLSEVWGRRPLFIVSGLVFVIFMAVCSVVSNIAGMLVNRFLTGVGASVFSTVVGGVLADIWANHERGTPMAFFAASALVASGAGPLVSGALVRSLGHRNLAWKWTFWYQAILDAILVLAIFLFFSESRKCVILSRKAKALNSWYEELEARGVFGLYIRPGMAKPAASASLKAAPTTPIHKEADEGNDNDADLDERKIGDTPSSSHMQLRRIRWVVEEDEQRASLAQIIATSVKRPFFLLFTEPIIFWFSLWAAFSWGILYQSFSLVPILYGTDNFAQTDRIYTALTIAPVIATACSIYSDTLLQHPQWRRHAADDEGGEFHYSPSRFWAVMRAKFPAEAPEARLYFAAVTAIFLPVGLFLALMSEVRTDGTNYVQAVGFGLSMWGIYSVYLSTFNYLADAYHIYASSALAAQSFCRNTFGGIFPLITHAMFDRLGVKGAGGLLGGIGAALSLTPWVLIFFGQTIRSKSRVALSLKNT